MTCRDNERVLETVDRLEAAVAYHLEAIFVVAAVCHKDIARLINVADLAHLGPRIEVGEEVKTQEAEASLTGAKLLSAKRKERREAEGLGW